VARHVKQMELTERKWGAKLEGIRKQQKRAYGRCIVRWATEGLPNKVNADVLHEFKAAKKQGAKFDPVACRVCACGGVCVCVRARARWFCLVADSSPWCAQGADR
jgi:hypothetical protein